MTVQVADRFVDVVVRDSWIMKPAGLVAALREPAGRNPAASSLTVAEALSSLDDERALAIVRSVLDAAYFSVLSLFDAGLKNSGVRVRIQCGTQDWDSSDPTTDLRDLYRDKVEPNGFVRMSP
jgi:hypothetical protein